MAYTTINKSTAHFNTKLYTGNGGTNAITGVGFQPDKVWIKERNGTNNHEINDVIRGVNYQLYPNLANAETNAANHLTAFGTDGFTVGSDGSLNTNNNTYVSWNWKANGAGSANTDGSINSTVSVNSTAGFSIVSYTGTGSNPATVGHGLGVTPKMIIVKPRSIAYSWCVYHVDAGAGNLLYYDTNGAAGGSSVWNSTSPTSSVFTVNDNQVNKSGETHIAYCFAEKTGYSRFSSYKGNGNANGTFVYTGFKPAFVMCKRTDGGTQNWCIMDNKRGYNPDVQQLHPNTSGVETLGSGDTLDLLSNGFKMRATDGDKNGNGETFIYMAIGQSLVGSNNVPCTGV